MTTPFVEYDSTYFYDEMFDELGQIRPHYQVLAEYLNTKTFRQLNDRQSYINKILLDLGITFNVYSDSEGTERIFPFDLIPRIISHSEWAGLEHGLKQRITALNLFIHDVYNEQKIIKDKVVPADIVFSSKGYLPQCSGLQPKQGIWCHITGTDLIRDRDGQYYVLEDNLRCPSGVAYVLENREIMKRAFSTLVQSSEIQPVSNYPTQLLELLKFVAANDRLTCAVLTPGIYNSAYFEHSFLARQMGIELVQPSDLIVRDHYVMMRTTRGLKKIDVLYRRIDDTFIDPTVFNPDSQLGIPGIFDVIRRGNVMMVNAPGTGVADDKVVYCYVPKMIKYYLGEDPIIPNVETHICAEPDQLDQVLNNLDKLVVKAANEAGGYGMLVGPHSTPEEQLEFREKLLENPRNYIAQPTLQFSRSPSFFETKIEGRHIDLRPYILYGEKISVIPGGLTRVALRKGSLVVNSSQGGGSKDTWVLAR